MFTDLISDDTILYDHSCEELLMEPAVVADIMNVLIPLLSCWMLFFVSKYIQ